MYSIVLSLSKESIKPRKTNLYTVYFMAFHNLAPLSSQTRHCRHILAVFNILILVPISDYAFKKTLKLKSNASKSKRPAGMTKLEFSF